MVQILAKKTELSRIWDCSVKNSSTIRGRQSDGSDAVNPSIRQSVNPGVINPAAQRPSIHQSVNPSILSIPVGGHTVCLSMGMSMGGWVG